MALQRDGDATSFFEVPDHPSLDTDLGPEFTVEAWINPATNVDTTEVLNEYMILNKEDSYEIAIGNEDPLAEATFRFAVQADELSWDWVRSDEPPIPVNTWTHVAATWDGLVARTFVNGKMVSSGDWPGPDGGKGDLNDTDASLKVGRRVRGIADRHSIFSGLIDEVRISRGLRYTEAGYAVPGKVFAPDADTVALYHFDEVVDGMVKDASSLGNHGVLRNQAVLVAVNTPYSDTP
jgi:hypothetical protein